MKIQRLLLSAIFSVLAIFSQAQSLDFVVDVEGGQIQGVLSEDPSVMVFKGIPYAAPPVGDLRWKKPQPVIPWDGVMMCDQFKKICPQTLTRPVNTIPEQFRSLYTEHDEDCLFVNVWAPADAVGDLQRNLPVMFWIHGGAFNTGSGITMSTDGDAWAKHGVILVTINYRLNILGFLSHPELTAEEGPSGNYGIYDQVAALKWTYDNIARFGGDPDNITIAGQSAGGMSVKDLVISPLAKPYIAKAIVQSGGGLGEMGAPSSQADLDAKGKAYMESGGYASIDEMRKAGYDDILSACKNRFQGGPHTDGVVLTESVAEAVADGNVADIPILMGYNDGDMASMTGETVPNFCSALKKVNRSPVYQYEFRRRVGKSGGAPHSGELNYMFYTLGRNSGEVPQEDWDLSEQMVTFWTNFCKFGNPNGEKSSAPWREYSDTDPFLMILDVPQ